MAPGEMRTDAERGEAATHIPVTAVTAGATVIAVPPPNSAGAIPFLSGKFFPDLEILKICNFWKIWKFYFQIFLRFFPDFPGAEGVLSAI